MVPIVQLNNGHILLSFFLICTADQTGPHGFVLPDPIFLRLPDPSWSLVPQIENDSVASTKYFIARPW